MPILCYGQDSVYVDMRDSESYQLVEWGGQTWFADNLRYKTSKSYCKVGKRTKERCLRGNYYHYMERDSVCPVDWHTATYDDWSAYFNSIVDSLKGVSIVVDSLADGYSISIADESGILNLLGQHNPLGLTDRGWIQGRKWQNLGTITLWVNRKDNDPRFHVHIGKKGYIKHVHDHNIKSRKRKQRRFTVRCVKDTVK